MSSARSRIPKTQSLVIVTSALRNYIPSTDPTTEMRRSEKGVPNLRYQAETNGVYWSVDIYMGHYYRARVGSGIGEVFRTIPSLLGYLIRTLGIVFEAP